MEVHMLAVDQIIQQAAAEGAFRNLEGAGKPIADLDDRRPMVDRWLERKVSDEGLSVPLPEGLQLRCDVADELRRLRTLTDLTEARMMLLALNARIREVNARHISGPCSNIAPLNVEATLQAWVSSR